MVLFAGTAAGNTYRLTTSSLNTLLLSETHSAAVTDVAYAPKVSERFCTSSADGTLRIWDASDYTVVVQAVVVDGTFFGVLLFCWMFEDREC